MGMLKSLICLREKYQMQSQASGTSQQTLLKEMTSTLSTSKLNTFSIKEKKETHFRQTAIEKAYN